VEHFKSDMYPLDEGERKGTGTGMELFLTVGHWPRFGRKTQKEAY
jgi:hypothetical protein